MKVAIFAWGYILTPEEMKTLQQKISLNDYYYIRNLFLSPMQSGEYLFGIILESVVEGENSILANRDIFSFNSNSPEGLKIKQCYQNCVKPFLPEVENPNPNYVLGIFEEGPDDFEAI